MRRLCASALSVLLAMSWLVSLPTSQTAQAAPVSAPKAAPSHPVRGVKFTVSGKLTTKVVRPVELQRKAGSKWVKVATSKTSSSGRYSFSTTLSVSSAQLRVVAAKVKIGKKTYSRKVSKASTVRTVSVNPVSPMAREKVTIVESLGKKGARPVTLQRKSGGRWVSVQTVKSNAAGTASFSTSLSGTSSLRVVAPKTKIKKKKYAKITLAAFTVRTVGQSGTLSLPNTGITGQAIVAQTAFTPARAGRTVTLQRWSGSEWITVATATQDAAGKAVLGTSVSDEGAYIYRAVSSAYRGAPAATTASAQTTISSGVPEPSIVIGTLTNAVTGESYTTGLSASGGTAPLTWTATGLPDGMSLSTDGVLSGTPTTPGTYNIHLKVTDAKGKTAETTTQIVVAEPVGVSTDSLPAAIAEQDYVTVVSADGGTAPYSWSAAGLPTGLIMASDGTISGTTTVVGDHDVTVTVVDKNGKSAEATLTLTVSEALRMTTDTLPGGTVAEGYSATLAATGGLAPYTWSATGLPPGLNLHSETGVLSGAPSSAGTFDQVEITVTDDNGYTATASFSITIAAAFAITNTSLPGGVVGTTYPDVTLATAAGTGPYTWSATGLPAGLSLDTTTGALSGTPTEAGTFDAVTISVTDANSKTAHTDFTITIAPAVHITTATLPAGVVGTDYPETTLAAADGNSGSYFWVVNHLPDGLNFNGNTGVLSGVPTSAGSFDTVTFTVTDEAGKTAEATFTITIVPAVHITTTTLPGGVVGTDYPETTLTAADGNSGSYTWASTTLPDGLTLSSSGVITGTPTSSGVYDNVKITVTDADGKTAEATFSVTIDQAVHITTATLPNGVVGSSYPETTLTAAGGTGPYTWSSTTLPDGLTLSTSGVLSGTPTASGTFDNITVTATDANHKTAEASYTISIVTSVHITTTSLPDGIVGTDYTTTLAAADCSGSCTWSSSTLPDGLTLTEAGVLSGAPTTSGTFDNITVTVTDEASRTAEAAFTITIVPAVHITTATLPGGVAGTTYTTTTLTAADGNSTSYTWASTALPEGLSLSNAGVLSGTPTAAGTTEVTFTVTDADAKTAEAAFTITVVPAVHITTTALSDAVLNLAYPETTLAAADGTGPYTWSATGLPAGVSVNTTTGVLSGTPTESGTFNSVTITATDTNHKTASANYSLAVNTEIAITTPELPTAVVGEQYSATLAGLGGNTPYTWTVTTLPAGLSFDTNTGTITGTPTVAGNVDLNVTLTDNQDRTDTKTLTLTVRDAVHVTTATIPQAVVGTTYSASISADGGTAPYSWTSTPLPAGLTLSSTGVLSGTPTVDGMSPVTFTVTDSHGKIASAELSITIVPAVHITTTSLPNGIVGTTYTETQLTAADGNSGSYTWTSTTLPDGLSLSSAGVITGTPTSSGVYGSVKITVTDGAGKTAEATFSVTINQAVHITTASLPNGVADTAYPETTLTAADGNSTTYTWASTTLPEGLSLSEAGVLSGTPTTGGTTDVTFTVTDADGKTAEATFTITITKSVHITTTSLPSVEVGDAYPETTLTAADGNSASYAWSSTTLPDGLSLSEAGVLSGTPTAEGTNAVTFTVTDADGETATAELTITITAAAHLTNTALSIGVVGGDYTSTLTASGGTAPYTITAGTLPDGLTYTDGTISGTPTTAVLNTPVEFTITDGRNKITTTTLGLTVTKPVTASSGSAHACAITPAGGVECWGSNTSGQLGDGTTTNSLYPVKVSGLDGTAISVAAGSNHTCALLDNGKVRCWGADNYGQLGNGSGDPSTTPVDVLDIDSAVSIAAGQTFTCVTLATGTASCWGIGLNGQLGNGILASSQTPVGVINLTGVIDVQTGSSHACALTATGSVSCWGRNMFRQLGAGIATSISSTPVAVPDVSGVVDLSAHVGNHTCVATDAGAVKCWGQNNYAQVGIAAGGNVADAVTVSDVTDAAQVVAGSNHSCAITSAGAMRCWGSNSSGQLGTNASGTMSVASVAIDLGATAASASAGTNYTCARTTAGTLLCWGSNSSGQLANGYASNSTLPMTVSALSAFSTIAVGDGFSCGLTAAGAAKCWGSNSFGQLGDGTTTNSIQPVQVSGLDSGVAAIDLGTSRACALTTSGGVKCWGKNSEGALGNGTQTDSSVPVTPTGLDAGVVSVSTADRSTCAVLTDGTARCWGENGAYQLGDGSNITRTSPVQVGNLTDAVSVSVGAFHACVITTSGGLKCWGGNSQGAVGDGTTNSPVIYPANVSGLSSGVTAVTAGLQSTCAVVDSAVTCWGYNPFGQVGDGGTTDVLTPNTVPGLSTGMADVSTGVYHTCARATSGAVSCWGFNNSGQLGDGTTTERHSPTPVTDLSGAASSITAGGYSSCAMLTDGTVQCWGSNTNGQLGALTAYNPTPAAPIGLNVAALDAGTASLPGGVAGTAYASGPLTATGGVAPYTWAATGLPAGLSINADGSITGTPTADGTSEITFTVTDVRGKTATTTATITIGKAVRITTAGLPSVEAGDAYPETTLTAADGTPGYTWTSTALPAGLSLSEAGVLSGTPTADGTTAVTFTVTDAGGKTATADLSITITAAAHLTNTALSIGVVGGDYTTTLTADGGTAPYTYAATTLPAGLTLTDGVISGTPTAAGTNTAVELTITDAHSKTATTTLGLTVVEPKTETGGNATTCAITPTGGIECWGLNSSGQLGDGTTTNSSYPVAVTDLGGTAISVSTGLSHTCAVLSNGKIRCWGANAAGQLGTGDTTASLTPKDVEGIDSAVSIAAGQNYTCATLRDGTASCWGLGTSGQIGNGSSSSVSQPAAVTNLTNVMNVETGGTHACALTTTGDVSCWGRNQYRQIGAGGTAGVTIYNAPVAVPDVSGVVSLSAHMGAFTCATTNTGAVKCWGNNSTYQLGSTSVTASGDALTVPDVTDAVSVIVGGAHVCAINAAGATRCWGYNAYGQLGDGSIGTNSATPVLVSLADPAISAAAGTSHTCARTTTGALNCWGANTNGQLGNGTTTDSSTPVAVVGFDVAPLAADSVSLSAGVVGTDYSSSQLAATGGVSPYTWTSTTLPAGLSLSSAGVLSGTPTEAGTTEVTFTVTDVRGKTATTTASITIIAAVHITTDAALPGGVVGTAYSTQLEAAEGTGPYTWSSDVVPAGLTLSQDGVLSGTPTAATASTTMQITATDHNGKTDTKAITIVITPVIHGAAAISAGTNMACAITDAGGAECWGKNQTGQLGDGTVTPDSTIPVPVSGLSSGVRAVTAGASHACALTDAGGVKCWGTNQLGQLGDGSTMGTHEDETPYISAIPVDVVGLTSGVTAISAGANHTCAITNAGAVKCWGYNANGGLGNDSTTNSNVPVDVAGLTSGVTAIAGNNSSTCAITSSGGVKCWGGNGNGQLGDGSLDNRLTPVDVALAPGVSAVAISAHGATACALTDSGAVACWGRNNAGQLGIDSTTDSATPVTPTGMDSGVAAVSVGHNNVCALTAAGGVTCAGDNYYGQLGDGTTTAHLTPAAIPGLSSGVASVGVGATFICARLDSGAVKCLGANDLGQGGNGFRENATTPTDVFGYGPVSLHIATSGLPTGEVGIAYPATQINRAGGTAPYTWAATGLPNGLSIDASTGVISGTPTEVGTFNAVKVTLTDSTDATAETTLSLTTIAGVRVTTSSLPDGLVGASYAATTLAAADGTAPYVWSATGLPAGLSLDAGTGEISGTPTAYGVFSVAITATDHNGYTATTTVPLSVLAIAGATDDVLSLQSGQSNFTCEVTNVGRVKCWGQNTYGQIGDGTKIDALSAKVVDGIGSGVKAVATGLHFACAITNTGGVKCWGYNYSGQLGNGSTTDSLTPVEVTDGTTALSGITAIAAGANHACAVTSAGGVKCWGSGASGELGNGVSANSSVAVDVKDLAGTGTLTDVTALSGGVSHSCALLSSGAVNCWGANNFKQLGNSVVGSSNIPTTVADLSAVSQISSNQYTTCAATTAGAAKCWGRNNGGQLGVIGLTTSTPVTPTGLTTTGVVSIAAGAGHTCALTTSGTMCWGTNSSGQLGDGTRINHTEPALASEVTDSLIAITAGAGHMCGLTTSRAVECWGANAVGQLGIGISASVTSPLEATNVSSSVSAVSAGYHSTCAITTSGSVQCWGDNSAGELGDGTTTANAIPVTVQDSTGSALVGVTALADSRAGQFSCALTGSGAVYCWGVNGYGQLGRGTETVADTTTSSVAAQVTGLASGVTAISTGASAACAVTQAGTVKCWGYNNYGQLGDSTTTSKSYPVDVSGLDHVTAVSMGTTHACALIDDGSVKCWGNNSYGQLGDGTSTIRPTPMLVQGLSGATAIASGADYTCAIANGGLKCWGYNYYGQLGNGTTSTELLPADVTGLTSGVSAITTGTTHACAVTTDGTVKCWGRNLHGELGVGDLLDRTTPTIVASATPAAGISAGELHTCLVTTTGAPQCWGYNLNNELGQITATSTTPQTVLGTRD